MIWDDLNRICKHLWQNFLSSQKFKESEDYFTQLDKLRINDDLKPQRPKNDEMFGLSGNFKKLEMDWSF